MVSTAPWAAEAALARVTVPPVAPIAASPPMARPEPRRNPRRSTDFSATPARGDSVRGRPATPLVFFLSISVSLGSGSRALARYVVRRDRGLRNRHPGGASPRDRIASEAGGLEILVDMRR